MTPQAVLFAALSLSFVFNCSWIKKKRTGHPSQLAGGIHSYVLFSRTEISLQDIMLYFSGNDELFSLNLVNISM